LGDDSSKRKRDIARPPLSYKSNIPKRRETAVNVELPKEEVRISKSMPTFHIMRSLYEVHEMTALRAVRVSVHTTCFISGSIQMILMIGI
jgi:hypothetical protein